MSWIFLLELLIQNTAVTSKAIERALGRLQWATAVCPLTKSLMQPFWAWKMAVTSSSQPPKPVRLLALLMKEFFTIPYCQFSTLSARISVVGMQRCKCFGLRGGLHWWMVVRFSEPCQTLSFLVLFPDSSVSVSLGFQRRESQKEDSSS